MTNYDPNATDWRPGCGLPSPAEIASECERIRAGWSALEREKRRVGVVPELLAPVVRLAELPAVAL